MSEYTANMKSKLIEFLKNLNEKPASFYLLGDYDNPVHPNQALDELDFDYDELDVYEGLHFYCYTKNYVISSEFDENNGVKLVETPLSPSACKLYFESGGELCQQ